MGSDLDFGYGFDFGFDRAQLEHGELWVNPHRRMAAAGENEEGEDIPGTAIGPVAGETTLAEHNPCHSVSCPSRAAFPISHVHRPSSKGCRIPLACAYHDQLWRPYYQHHVRQRSTRSVAGPSSSRIGRSASLLQASYWQNGNDTALA